MDPGGLVKWKHPASRKWTAAVALLDELPRMSVQGNVVTEDLTRGFGAAPGVMNSGGSRLEGRTCSIAQVPSTWHSAINPPHNSAYSTNCCDIPTNGPNSRRTGCFILLCTPQIKSCRSTTLFEIAETKNIVVLRLYQTSSTRK